MARLGVSGRETYAPKPGGHFHIPTTLRGDSDEKLMQRNKTKCEVLSELAALAVPGLRWKLPCSSVALTRISAGSASLSSVYSGLQAQRVC